MSGWAILNKEKTQILREFSEPRMFFYEDIFTENVQELINPGTDQQQFVNVEKVIDNSRNIYPDHFRLPLAERIKVGIYEITDDPRPDEEQVIITHHELELTTDPEILVTRHWISTPRTEEDKLQRLSQQAEQMCDQIDAHRDSLGNTGFEFQGHTYELRGTSDPLNFVSQALFAFLTLNTEFKNMIAQVSPELAAQIVWDGNEKWTDKNNEDILIPNAMTMIIMALTAATSKKRVIRNAIAHKKIVRAMALDSSTLLEEIKSYDYSGGW